ncbi:DUF732 domain-containing protein [Geodermatophilus sp. SYSU D00965]
MTRRGAHERPSQPSWPRRLAAVLAVLALGAGLAYLLTSTTGRDAAPVAASTSPSPPPPSPATVTVTAPMSDDQVRAAFVTLAAQVRGYALPAEQVPALAQQTCGTIAAAGDADAVWRAAGDLEQPHGLPVGAAWEFVDLAVTAYCPQHHGLVLRTTAAMGD